MNNPSGDNSKKDSPSSNLNGFRKFAVGVSNAVGSSKAFLAAVTIVIVWWLTGPIFDYSNTWQLVINTSTTIVTFLMVFLIQNTQNRDSKAIHLKLDELIKGIRGARNTMMNLEEMSDDDIEVLQQQFRTLHNKYEKVAKDRENKKANQRQKS